MSLLNIDTASHMEEVHAIATTVGSSSMALLWLGLFVGLALARGWMTTWFKHPVGIGLGVAGIELMIALALSVVVQRWLGLHRWPVLYAMAYASYTLVTGHVVISGSEVEGGLIRGVVLAPWLILVGLWMVGGSTGIAPVPETPGRESGRTLATDPSCVRPLG